MNDSETKSQMHTTFLHNLMNEIIQINKVTTTHPPHRKATDTMSQFIYSFTDQIFGKLGKKRLLFLPTK